MELFRADCVDGEIEVHSEFYETVRLTRGGQAVNERLKEG